VSAKPTDEGSHSDFRAGGKGGTERLIDPSSDPFGATFSHKGRRIVCARFGKSACAKATKTG
jgi:hypothetical protein